MLKNLQDYLLSKSEAGISHNAFKKNMYTIFSDPDGTHYSSTSFSTLNIDKLWGILVDNQHVGNNWCRQSNSLMNNAKNVRDTSKGQWL